MADLNMPSLQELGQMEFMSPLANQQAQRQIDLATMFQKQNLQSGEHALQKAAMDNMFQTQNDPLKLQGKKLENEGITSDNIIKKINAEQRQQLAPMELEAKRMEIVKKWSDDKLAKAMNDAQEMIWSGDPAAAEKGKSLYMNSFKELSERRKHQDTVSLHKMDNDSAERRSAGNNAATLGAAQISANARMATAKSRQKLAGTVEDQIAGAKTFQHAANIYEAAAIKAMNEGDDEAANHYKQLAARSLLADQQRGTAGATDARLGAQPDVSRLTNGRIQPQGRSLPPVPEIPSRSASGPVTNAPPVVKPIPKLPEGSKQIGTHKGKPVYQTPDGKKFLGE